MTWITLPASNGLDVYSVDRSSQHDAPVTVRHTHTLTICTDDQIALARFTSPTEAVEPSVLLYNQHELLGVEYNLHAGTFLPTFRVCGLGDNQTRVSKAGDTAYALQKNQRLTVLERIDSAKASRTFDQRTVLTDDFYCQIESDDMIRFGHVNGSQREMELLSATINEYDESINPTFTTVYEQDESFTTQLHQSPNLFLYYGDNVGKRIMIFSFHVTDTDMDLLSSFIIPIDPDVFVDDRLQFAREPVFAIEAMNVGSGTGSLIILDIHDHFFSTHSVPDLDGRTIGSVSFSPNHSHLCIMHHVLTDDFGVQDVMLSLYQRADANYCKKVCEICLQRFCEMILLNDLFVVYENRVSCIDKDVKNTSKQDNQDTLMIPMFYDLFGRKLDVTGEPIEIDLSSLALQRQAFTRQTPSQIEMVAKYRETEIVISIDHSNQWWRYSDVAPDTDSDDSDTSNYEQVVSHETTITSIEDAESADTS